MYVHPYVYVSIPSLFCLLCVQHGFFLAFVFVLYSYSDTMQFVKKRYKNQIDLLE